MSAAPFSWSALPRDVAERLVAASEGYSHLVTTGQLCFEWAAKGAEHAWLIGLGFDLQVRAWETNPADPQLSAHLLALESRLGRLDATRRQIMELAACGTDPGGKQYDFASLRGRAEAEMALGRYAQAMESLAPLAEAGFGEAALHMGECLLQVGEAADAQRLWRASLAVAPWQSSLLLRLHDLATGTRDKRSLPAGDIAIALYSWNKAESLDRTLATLAASDIGTARVIALDNGSTDGTADVIDAWAQRMGADRFTAIHLPVNVGAPAARNWLMRHEAVAACDWVAYLDDDVQLPADWLTGLGAAAAAYPGAGAWGLRVVNQAEPWIVQHADLFFLPTQDGSQDQTPKPTFAVAKPHREGADLGRFSYLRPCASVTGCCHLFERKTLLAQGGFDLQFSPSQFDDLDHDIRLAKAGKSVIYQGHVAIGHEKAAGSALGEDGQQPYGVTGNITKLYAKHSPKDMDAVRTIQFEHALADLMAKESHVTLQPS